VYSSGYLQFVSEAFKERYKKIKKWKVSEEEEEDPGGGVSPAGRKKQKTVQSEEEQEKTKKQKGEALRQMLEERRRCDEMVVKACLRKQNKDPYKQALREAIRNRVESYCRSIRNASFGHMHIAKEMYRNVTHMETVEVPDEFFNENFIRRLLVGTGEASTKTMSECMLSTNIAPNFASTILDTRMSGIY